MNIDIYLTYLIVRRLNCDFCCYKYYLVSILAVKYFPVSSVISFRIPRNEITVKRVSSRNLFCC